jgi:hypothetical protein
MSGAVEPWLAFAHEDLQVAELALKDCHSSPFLRWLMNPSNT